MNENNPHLNKAAAEEKQKPVIIWFFSWFFRRPGIQIMFVLTALCIPVLTLLYFVILPVIRFKPLPVHLKEEAQRDSLQANEKATVAFGDPVTLSKIFYKEQNLNFLQNRLHLVRQDSIYLVLNLADSLLDIEIKGLPVHRCKLLGIEVTNRLKIARHNELLKWLDQSFTLKHEFATIPKVPVLVVDAPKDTNEVSKLPKKALEPEKTAVFLTLLFDRQLVVQIEQTEPVPEEELPLIQQYNQQVDSTFGHSFLQKIRQPMPADMPVLIKLRMSEADARSVYRSIPHLNSAQLLITPFEKI